MTAHGVSLASLTHLTARPRRRRYRSAAERGSGGFLRIARSRFEEHDAAGGALAARSLEYVLATPFGLDTVAGLGTVTLHQTIVTAAEHAIVEAALQATARYDIRAE